MHGGGMGPSMLAGKIAADTALKAIDKGDTSIKGLWEYNVRFLEEYGKKQAGYDIFRMFLQGLSDEDINYGMEKGFVTEKELNAMSKGEELKLGKIEVLKKAVWGLRRLNLLMRLRKVLNLMKRARKLYERYPKEPSNFEYWRRLAEELFKEVKEVLS
jgi:flavin-dependent dehydrogenase